MMKDISIKRIFRWYIAVLSVFMILFVFQGYEAAALNSSEVTKIVNYTAYDSTFAGCGTCIFWKYIQVDYVSYPHIENFYVTNPSLMSMPAGYGWQNDYSDFTIVSGGSGSGVVFIDIQRGVVSYYFNRGNVITAPVITLSFSNPGIFKQVYSTNERTGAVNSSSPAFLVDRNGVNRSNDQIFRGVGQVNTTTYEFWGYGSNITDYYYIDTDQYYYQLGSTVKVGYYAPANSLIQIKDSNNYLQDYQMNVSGAGTSNFPLQGSWNFNEGAYKVQLYNQSGYLVDSRNFYILNSTAYADIFKNHSWNYTTSEVNKTLQNISAYNTGNAKTVLGYIMPQVFSAIPAKVIGVGTLGFMLTVAGFLIKGKR